MSNPVDDPFWAETISFIGKTIGRDTPFIGPRELRLVLPKAFSYDWVHAIDDINDYAGAAVHKGLMHELPLPVLRIMKNEWKCVFANAVFVFFVPANSPLQAIAGEHFDAFCHALQAQEKLAAETKPFLLEHTAFLVLASHSAKDLDETLHSLAILHSPMLVTATASNDPGPRDSVCRQWHAAYEGAAATPAKAMESGIRRLLAEDDNDWIAVFDDTVVARPDYLVVMEKYRNATTCPVLSGYWDGTETARRAFRRDGMDLIFSPASKSILIYGHRKYWERRMQTNASSRDGAVDMLVIPGLVIPRRDCVPMRPQAA